MHNAGFNLKIFLFSIALVFIGVLSNGQGLVGGQGDLLLARALTIQANLITKDPSKENAYLDLALLLALGSTKLKKDAPESYPTSLVPTLYSKNAGVITFRKDNSFTFIPERNIMVSASPDGSLSFWDVTITAQCHGI